MNTEYRIDTREQQIACIACVAEIVPSRDMFVKIYEKKASRSAAQNRMYWQWLTDMQNTDVETFKGTAKEDWHRLMKYHFLVPIYTRDNLEFAEMWASIKNIPRFEADTSKIIKFVIDNTSTTNADVKQMSEYLTSIEHYAHLKGIQLKTDERLYKESMGL